MGSVYRRGNIFWIKYYANGEPRYESSESSVKQDAINLLKKKLNTPGPRASGKVTVSDLLNELLVYYRTHNPKSYGRMCRPAVAHLLKYWDGWKASKVTTAAINRYKEQRTDEEASNGTINRELAMLRRAYKLAFEATPKKVSEVPKFESLPEASPRQGFLEVSQYKALLDAMTEDLRPVFIVGYHTGARRGEILGIRKDQVDWAAKQIRLNVGETKNGGGRYLPIYGDMIPAIEPLLARPGDRLFTRRASGEPIVNLQPGWLNACTKAGVPNLLFHDLRRSAVRNMTRAGIPREVAMRISGHRTEAMFRRYNVVSEGDIDMAAEKMTAFMSPRAASKSANSYNNGDNSTEVVEP